MSDVQGPESGVYCTRRMSGVRGPESGVYYTWVVSVIRASRRAEAVTLRNARLASAASVTRLRTPDPGPRTGCNQ